MSDTAEVQPVPNTLTVVMADTWTTSIALQHEGEHRPYKRRTVQVALTPEQVSALTPRRIGTNFGDVPVLEEILDCWLEVRDG